MHAFRFDPPTLGDFAALLGPRGFTRLEGLPPAHEAVFRKIVAVNGNVFSLRVYTAVNPDGTTRPKGQDAIRVQIWARGPHGPYKVRGCKRTMRVTSWRHNLIRKVDALQSWALECPAGTYSPGVSTAIAAVPSLRQRLDCPQRGQAWPISWMYDLSSLQGPDTLLGVSHRETQPAPPDLAAGLACDTASRRRPRSATPAQRLVGSPLTGEPARDTWSCGGSGGRCLSHDPTGEIYDEERTGGHG